MYNDPDGLLASEIKRIEAMAAEQVKNVCKMLMEVDRHEKKQALTRFSMELEPPFIGFTLKRMLEYATNKKDYEICAVIAEVARERKIELHDPFTY